MISLNRKLKLGRIKNIVDYICFNVERLQYPVVKNQGFLKTVLNNL